MATQLTQEWFLTGMFPEVVSEIARLLEHLVTTSIQALEKEIFPVGNGILNLDHPMPVVWNSLEVFLRDHIMHQSLIVKSMLRLSDYLLILICRIVL